MSNRTAPLGAVVRLYVDLERQVNEGDIIETSTGRGYRVLSVRVQERGKNVGRQHLMCVVMPADWMSDAERWRTRLPIGSFIHRIRWYRRGRGAGVTVRSR